MNEWSAPDAQGIRTRQLDVGARITLRGRRERSRPEPDPQTASVWPQEWRAMLQRWLKRRSATLRWSTLLGDAGHLAKHEAEALRDALLAAGYLQVQERLNDGRWQCQTISFQHLESLYVALNLPNPDAWQAEWSQLQALELPSVLAAASGQLSPGMVGLRRHRLLHSLARWADAARAGTQRDFAWFACGNTKGIASADWQWLQEQIDLPALGIEPHVPLLRIRAPLCLAGGLQLDAAPDFIGVTPASLRDLPSQAGAVERWILIENETSFERSLRTCPPGTAIVWLPGFPPGWWKQAIDSLLAAAPAPAWIACDPDPAGIRIALQAGALWDRRQLRWHPWLMSATDLRDLGQREALTAGDREELSRLATLELPIELRGLAGALAEDDRKGEQEGMAWRFPESGGSANHMAGHSR